MLFLRNYSTRHLTRATAVFVMVTFWSSWSGCAAWDTDRWNIDNLRDERSIDIEQRLDREKPIVKNPF